MMGDGDSAGARDDPGQIADAELVGLGKGGRRVSRVGSASRVRAPRTFRPARRGEARPSADRLGLLEVEAEDSQRSSAARVHPNGPLIR